MVEAQFSTCVGLRVARLGRIYVLVALIGAAGCATDLDAAPQHAGVPAEVLRTKTPIKHVVVVFGENISFDHYFGTYPNAENGPDELRFVADPRTPTPNNLATPLDPTDGFVPLLGLDLLNANPNFANTDNGGDAANPIRLGPSQAATADMGHLYTPEQRAAHGGAMDLFPLYVGNGGPPPASLAALGKGLVMAYYDGNTVSAIWSYAQNFALNDNSWSTTFGPSTPGAINLISGQTNGFDQVNVDLPTSGTPDGNGGDTLIADPDPLGDDCSEAAERVSLKGRNIGDMLNAKDISWGWFQGGFDLGVVNEDASTGCERRSPQTVLEASAIPRDYTAHHAPFQYYRTTANPMHARPSSVTAIGSTFQKDGRTLDPANHHYDSRDFFTALQAGNLPAVSYLKAPAFQDGHAGTSNPIDEQSFIVQVVSALQASPAWNSTAIILAYDDSDGWYDHQAPPIVNPSNGIADALNGEQLCNQGAQQLGPVPLSPLHGRDENPALGRCGYGTRLPLLVISPFARKNYIDHTLTDQTSILKFIEDNWLSGERVQPGGSFDTIAGPIENMFQCPDGRGEFPRCDQ